MADLLTLNSIDGSDGNGAALRFINNSRSGLSLALGRVSARRIDPSTIRLDLGVAGDVSASSSGETPALLSLTRGVTTSAVATAPGSTLEVGGPLSVTGAATLGGTLSVTGAATLGGTLSVTGATTLGGTLNVAGAATLGSTLNVAGAATLGGPLNVAGNLSLGGSLNGRNVAADGTRLDQHVANMSNPHGTTAVQVGALPIGGGSLGGGLTISGDLRVEGHYSWTSPRNFRLQSSGAGEWSFDFQNEDPDSRWSVWGPGVGSVLAVRNNGRVGINLINPAMPLHVNGWTRVGGTGSDFLQLEAGFGNAERSTFRFDTNYLSLWHPGVGDFVIFNGKKRVTFTLFGRTITINLDGQVEFKRSVTIDGALTVDGDLRVNGTLNAAKKNGFVVDQFVNSRGEALEAGDVIVVSKGQEALYYSEQGGIPVPEVDLTRRPYDGRVCGIVAEVFAPGRPEALDAAGAEEQAEETVVDSLADLLGPERSVVQPGQIGLMVTLGAFARCKVDADIAPVEPGDLLTTSPTPGHAQKVLDRDQAVGAILGKALGAIERGRGTIPVLVLLQ